MSSRNRIRIASWALALCCLPIAAQAGAQTHSLTSIEEDIRVSAAQAYEQGRYDEAKRLFEQLLHLAPGQPDAVRYLELLRRRERAMALALALARARSGAEREEPAGEPAAPTLSRDAPTVVAPAAASLPPPEEEPAEEPSAAAPLAREAPVRVGAIGLFINGEEVSIKRPILVQDGEALIPLREVAPQLHTTLVGLGEGRFRLLLPDGASQDIVAGSGGEPVLTARDLRDYFDVEVTLDEPGRALHVRTRAPSGFTTYAVPKPAEQIAEEARVAEEARRAALPPEPEVLTEIPDAARPTVELDGTVSYSYRHTRRATPERTATAAIRGRAHDFRVSGETTRRDRNGIFDHEYTYLNLERPDLLIGLFDQTTDLYPLRNQSDEVSGLKVRKTWDRMHTTSFTGGQIHDTVSGTAGLASYDGRLYQVGEEVLPADWLRLRSSLLYLEREAEDAAKVGTTAFPRENFVSFGDAELRLPHDVSVSGQVARAAYEPDQEADGSVTDWNWRLGSALQRPRYNLGFAYEFVGDRYASIGDPAVYQDYAGWNLFGGFRLTRDWSLSGGVLRYHDNVADDPGRAEQDNQALSLSSSLRLPFEHTLSLTLNNFLSDPSGPDGGTSNRTNLYRADYLLPFLFGTRLLLDYEFLTSRQSAGDNTDSRGYGGSLYKGFLGGSSLFLSQQFTHREPESSDDTRNAVTSFSGTYQFHRDLGLYFNSSYTRDMTEREPGTDTVAGSAGVRFQLYKDTALSSEYRVNSYNLDTERDRWPRNWSVFFLVSQGLHWASPPNFGTVEGRVIQDLNANGRADAGEPGVPEVAARLEKRREVQTAADGTFRFTRVVPGKKTVALDLASLPLEWTTAESARIIDVGKQRRTRVVFPLVKAAAVGARVFIDENGDGVFQEVEEPVEEVAVILLPDDQFRRTDADGSVHFDHLMPGEYRLRVHRDDLPVGYELAGDEELAVSLSPGQDFRDVPFALRLRGTPKAF